MTELKRGATDDDHERLFYASLLSGDTAGVEDALRMLATRDVGRAASLKIALTLAGLPRP